MQTHPDGCCSVPGNLSTCVSRPSRGQPDPAHREKATQNYTGSLAQAMMYNGSSAEEQ